jgi:hypothetical protein
MTQISSTFKSAWLTPRTASYVAALVREGDRFDYNKWLQQVREKETQVKELQKTVARIVPPEIDTPASTFDRREAAPESGLFNGQASIPIGMTRSRRKTRNSTSVTRTTRRLEKVCDAWNEFQANRARDAVYGYLKAVFAIVAHYKVRRTTKKLLRRAVEFAELPLDKNADPFTPLFAAPVTTTPTARQPANGRGHCDMSVVASCQRRN